MTSSRADLADDVEVWDLDPGDDFGRPWTGPWCAKRAEVLAAGAVQILVALIDRHGSPAVVRAERSRPGGPWVWLARIAEEVDGREAEAFEEMRGYALARLERLAAAEAAHVAARTSGATCAEGPVCEAPAQPSAVLPEGSGGTETSECQGLGDRLWHTGGAALVDPLGFCGVPPPRPAPGTLCVAAPPREFTQPLNI